MKSDAGDIRCSMRNGVRSLKRFPRCILGTRCIPWDEHGEFVESIFRRGIRSTLSVGTRHQYVFGTAGEGYAVTDRQFDQITAAFADEMHQGGAEPMVGVIGLSLGTMCERIRRCHDQGINLFQISLPAWGALNDRELFSFFANVCGAFQDCRFLHYNLPRAKRLVTGPEYGRLADAHPNFVATKNTSDSLSHIQSLQEDAPQLQHFLSERGYAHGSVFGECGILASLIMNWPKLHALLDAGIRGDIAAMTTIQRECSLVLQTLFEVVPAGRIDGAYDKLFEKMYDAEFPLRLLPPYDGSTDDEFHAFVRLLSDRLPDWIPDTTNRDCNTTVT